MRQEQERARGLEWVLLLAGALAAAAPLRSYDLFWHLATGDRILAAGAVPRVDPFSFTAAGTPWVDHSWLFQVGLALAWSTAGDWGPWILKVLCGALLAWVFVSRCRSWSVPPAATAVLVVVALQGLSFRLMFRPELATLVLVALAAWVLCPAPCGEPIRTRRLLWMIPLTVFWVNLHGGAILAPLIVAACIAGIAAGRLGGRHLRVSANAPLLPALLLLLPATILAMLVNPYGYRVLEIPFRLTSIVDQEWAVNPEWAWPDPSVFPLLYLAVGGLLTAAIFLRRRVEPLSFALGLLGAVLALRYVRNIGVFFVLLPFAAAPLLAHSVAWARSGRRLVALAAAAGCLWVGWAPAWATLGPGTRPPRPGLEAMRYPVAAADFLERHRIRGGLFNEVGFGGYLIWRFPDTPVFIDGRNEIYPDLLEEIHRGLQDVEEFWRMTDRHGLQAAILRYPAEGVTVLYPEPGGGRQAIQRSWSEVYFPRAEWALVYWDDTAMIRVRRDGADAAWLAQYEYRHLNPDDWPFLARELEAGRVQASDLLGEVRRKRASDETCHRARVLEGLLTSRFAGRPGGQQGSES